MSALIYQVTPESYDGEHDFIPSMLLNNSASEVETTRLKVLLYQLSNKMELALDLREELADAQVIVTLTATAIKERLFAAAMRRLDVELAGQLLVAGVNPNMSILKKLPEVKTVRPARQKNLYMCLSHNGYSCAPLQWAISARKASLVKVLIRVGAKVDLILQDQLVANGAAVDRAADPSRPTALLLAVASGNADLVGFILESGAEVDRQYRPPDTKSLKLNPFQVALLKSDIRILDLLTRSHGYIVPTSCCFNAPALAICLQDLEKVLLYHRTVVVDVTAPFREEENPLATALLVKKLDLARPWTSILHPPPVPC
ncbi:hypothetical protein DL770_007603 [Monosporascus sp. CRB-9-2]|nr:hypothetical protein DL770_007603 [Monosporascus sp. CRB-9-2]